MSDQGTPVEQDTPVWIRYSKLIPEELSTAGWALWAVGNGPTLYGAERYMAVLLKDVEDPDGTRVSGDGATQEEAVRGAIREALTLEGGHRS